VAAPPRASGGGFEDRLDRLVVDPVRVADAFESRLPNAGTEEARDVAALETATWFKTFTGGWPKCPRDDDEEE